MDSSGMMETIEVEIGMVEVEMLQRQIAVKNERIGELEARVVKLEMLLEEVAPSSPRPPEQVELPEEPPTSSLTPKARRKWEKRNSQRDRRPPLLLATAAAYDVDVRNMLP